MVKNENHGRYINVRPEVGLLTSTARTFIQEGVTTEYATQVVGTTLDNGRVYAQYLKKSSRVLYDSDVAAQPSVVTSWVGGESLKSDAVFLPQSHNDLFNADQPDWRAIDDSLESDRRQKNNEFIGNTDYIAVPYKQSYSAVKEKNVDEIEKFVQTSPSLSYSINSKIAHNFLPQLGVLEENARKVAANKVLPIGDLPTYTIKQNYDPNAAYVVSNDYNYDLENDDNSEEAFGRNPKRIYTNLISSQLKTEQALETRNFNSSPKPIIAVSRNLATVTYYGFADFTTVVGDSVIVFSPSTSSGNMNYNAHVTSIKGEATLGAGMPQEPSVSKVPITIAQDIIEPTITEMSANSKTSIETFSSTMINFNEVPENTVTSFMDETILTQNSIDVLEKTEDIIQQTQSQSSSSMSTPVTLSRPSDEDILRIYNSLANAGNDKSVILTNTSEASVTPSVNVDESFTSVKETLEISNLQALEDATTKLETSNVQTFGGATTIFFEEDPFDNFVEPVKTMNILESTSSLIRESVSEVSIDSNTIVMNSKSQNTDSEESKYTQKNVENLNSIDEITNDIVVPSSEINLVNNLNKFIATTEPQSEQYSHETMKPSTQDIMTTNNNILSNVLVKEIDPNKEEVPNDCISTSQVFLTQQPKTVTQFETVVFSEGSELKTEIKEEIIPTFEIKEATKYYCIQASKIQLNQLENTLEPTTTPVLNQIENSLEHVTVSEGSELEVTTPKFEQKQEENDTTVLNLNEVSSVETNTEQIMVEEKNIEENNEEDSKHSSAEVMDNDDEDQQEDEEEVASDVTDDEDDDEEEEEIELIYKTLYTTYTYLTTFFHDDATSISSHTEIVTNVMTSTLGINISKLSTNTNPNHNEINPSSVSETNFLIETTKRFEVPSEVESLIRTDDDDNEENETVLNNLDHINKSSETLATFYTTYTYYTTIFAEGETEIMSHTEVITNIKKSSIVESEKIMPSLSLQQNDISLSSIPLVTTTTNAMEGIATIPNIPDLGDLSAITLITDVRSSSSSGDKQIISNKLESNNVQQHSIYEDQLSSESNTDVDEIIPSATLLLQTSFTTFTYYTTMYSGDKTNVISRLETMTNTVTETLQPSKTISLGDNTVPITYFTTFTYWTKLAKDGQITTLSREETISNVVLPTPIQTEIQTQYENPTIMQKVQEQSQPEQQTTEASVNEENSLKIAMAELENKLVTLQTNDQAIINDKSTENSQIKTNILEPTTYYTTYTYYTTSYENDKTSTVSRFETITNIVTPTVAITNNPITENTQEPAILESLTSSSSINTQNNTQQSSTLDLILYDFKKIIDADGVSTIFFTTEIKPTVNSEGLLTQVVSSSSSLLINEEKRSTQATASLETVPASIESGSAKGNLPKQYKTGLVRLIEGTRIGNGTTTLYQSKVIGTVIDQRYAQIIESTSSFIFENTNSASVDLDHNIDIIPTLSSDITNIQTTQHESIYNINTANVQGSITEQNTESIPKQEGDVEQEEDNLAKTDERLRLPFQTKKSQYSTAVKPFSNRTRPQFAGKKNSSATIITRSDFTPTITATPALKTINRFSSTRRGGIGGGSVGNSLALNTPSRRFGRPSKSVIGGLSSAGFSSSSSRNRFASSSNPRGSFASSSRRLGASAAVRPSFSRPPLFSSGFPGNSRLRVRPTATLDFGDISSSVDITTSNPLNSQEDNTEDSVDDQDEQDEENTTTENSRRQNPLLRLRRPLNRPQGFTPARVQTNNPNNPVTIRRNPFINNSRGAATTTTTTTTAKPKPRTFQPPLITQNRIRPTSSLFPPRNIFGLQKPKTNTEETKDLSEEDTNENTDDSDYEDDDEEELEGDEDEENSRRRRSNNKRSKREADSSQQNRSNFRNRFRRPKLASAPQQHEATSHEDEANETKETTKSSSSLTTTTPHRTRARFGNRYSGNTSSSTTTASSTESTTTNHKSIRPTRPSHSNGSRPQFTLRDKDSSSTSTTQKGLTTNKRPAFRRPQPPGSGSASNRRISSSTASSNKRRLKSFTSNDATTTSRNTVNGRIRSSSSTVSGRGRPTTGTSRENNTGGRSRARNNHNYNNSNDPVVIENSGTITVTHVIPAEVTIPVVNGKVTEYKQVVTAKTSTEILGPQQYTTTIGINGMTQLALTREDSSVNYNGATEVTQYILHETPTTTITFTPTTIRGRKTSFSHVLPSTVYSVEQVISTVQPQLSANAPLANILLSQLLLGNVGLPAAGNPLLGALGGALTQPGVGLATALGSPPQPATPVTEYRTHASTYVTTVYEGQSTVLPVTFQGKKILTTIYDTTAQTITATEFITDTIVTTPTVNVQPQPVVNSLLLQQLLLQQHLQQQQQQQLQQPTPDPSFPLNAILNSVPPQFLLGGDNLQELEVSNNIRGSGQGDLNEEEDFAVGSAVDLDDISLQAQVQTHKTGRKKSRKSAKNHKRKQINADFQQTPESSVITLYVSGRRPGEFSTVLSTVQIRPDSTVYKRHAHTIDSETDFLNEGSEIVPEIILLDDKDNKNEILYENGSPPNYLATQSLESIVGDVSLWYNSQNTASTKKTSNHDPQYTINNKYSLNDISESSDISLNTKHFFA